MLRSTEHYNGRWGISFVLSLLYVVSVCFSTATYQGQLAIKRKWFFTEKRQKRKTQDNHNKYILIFGIASRSNPTKVSPFEMRQRKRYECATQQRYTVDDDDDTWIRAENVNRVQKWHKISRCHSAIHICNVRRCGNLFGLYLSGSLKLARPMCIFDCRSSKTSIATTQNCA